MVKNVLFYLSKILKILLKNYFLFIRAKYSSQGNYLLIFSKSLPCSDDDDVGLCVCWRDVLPEVG